ncbi:MAG: aldose 1-epimerase [Acetobacteraceae bacterium]
MFDLVAGDARLILCPALGGSIGGWQRRGVDLLRPTPAEALQGTSSRALSCFPLIPFSNRIAWGRFSFGGESFQLDRNFGDHPHTIHGNAWQRAWDVASQSATEAQLTLAHDPATDSGSHWPYRYQAGLLYTLAPDSLHVTISFHNTDTRAQPVGLGLHPYQPHTPQTAIAFRAGSVWHTGRIRCRTSACRRKGRGASTLATSSPGRRWTIATPAWTGRAEITRPEHGVRLVIAGDDIFRHLVVYTPDAKPYFAVEPASNMTDAVNRMDTVADHGLRVLAPGKAWCGRCGSRSRTWADRSGRAAICAWVSKARALPFDPVKGEAFEILLFFCRIGIGVI